MIGSLIGAGLSIAGSIFGGSKAAKERRKVKKQLEQQQKDNQNWYNQRYNEDSTQRADAQRVLTMAQEEVKKRNRAAAGTQAVMGGTDESMAATQEQNSRVLSDATAQIAAAGDARKDQIEQQYLSNKNSIENKEMEYNAQTAQNITDATSGLLDTVSGIASLF